MTPETIAKLVAAEYDLCGLDGALKDVARDIAATGCPGCFRSSRDLLLARRLLRRALRRIDGPLTRAARLAELEAGPAPF